MAARATIMRAIRVSKFGGPEVLQVEKVPVPEPQQDQVLIQVKAIGVNPVDTYIRAGPRPGQTPGDLPYTPGSDAAGLVAAVGPDVKDVKVGDRVFTCQLQRITGAYAEYMLASAALVFKLPDRLTFSQGAALGVPYFTAIRALKYKAQAKPGETVLVHGASGGVGVAACQIAAAWRLDVVGTASTDEGANLVRAAGARLVLNHKDPNHSQNLKNATGGKGFDVILEMLANVNLSLDLDVVRDYGRIVVVGNRGQIEIDPRKIMGAESIVTAVMLGKSTVGEWKEMGKDLLEGLEEQWIHPLIDKEYPLEQAAQAHEAVIEHSGGSKGKVVLTIA